MSQCYVTHIMPILFTYFSNSFKANPGICPCFAWSMIIIPIYYYKECLTLMCQVLVNLYGKQYPFNIQGVTGGTDQTSGGCSLC